MKDLEIIKEVLKESAIHGLQIEVVYSALKFMKQQPELTISEAIQFALNDWVK